MSHNSELQVAEEAAVEGVLSLLSSCSEPVFHELKAAMPGPGLVLDGVVDRDPRLFGECKGANPKLVSWMQASRCALDPSRQGPLALSGRQTESLAASGRLRLFESWSQ